ncbi:MAG TPA: hypothetical protein VL486_02495 [Verrucomicrobiae bacterium]|nr:hypothetical protein [Verrucomicrobiae bacterium]
MNGWDIGQKVVCINDSFPPAVADWCTSLPIAGYVYTIRAIQIGYNGPGGTQNLGLLLEEIVNPKSSLGYEAGFLTYRFVPWLDTCAETERGEVANTANGMRPDTHQTGMVWVPVNKLSDYTLYPTGLADVLLAGVSDLRCAYMGDVA